VDNISKGLYYRVFPEGSKTHTSKDSNISHSDLLLVPVDDDSCIQNENCHESIEDDNIRTLGPVVEIFEDGQKSFFLTNRCVMQPNMKEIQKDSLASIMGLSHQPVSLTDKYFHLSCNYNKQFLQQVEEYRLDNPSAAFWGELGMSLAHTVEFVVAVEYLVVPAAGAIFNAGAAYLGGVVSEEMAATASTVGSYIMTAGEQVMTGMTIKQSIEDIIGISHCEDEACRGEYTGRLIADFYFMKQLKNPFANEATAATELSSATDSVISDIESELDVAKQFDVYKDIQFSQDTLEFAENLSNDGSLTAEEVNKLRSKILENDLLSDVCGL
jgi:hypothetical protein